MKSNFHIQKVNYIWWMRLYNMYLTPLNFNYNTKEDWNETKYSHPRNFFVENELIILYGGRVTSRPKPTLRVSDGGTVKPMICDK